MVLFFRGMFTGKRARWGVALLGGALIVDLARANQPWILVEDYRSTHLGNCIIDLLRDKPYEHRIVMSPLTPTAGSLQLLQRMYALEWSQHLFPYNNIQSMDVVQLPRMPRDLVAFQRALMPSGDEDRLRLTPRVWQLTNTRYILGVADPANALNPELDPQFKRLRLVERFGFVAKPGIVHPTRYNELTATCLPDGPFALYEFNGALPRAALYTQWSVGTNDEAVLSRLASASFNPEQSVMVHSEIPAAVCATNNAQSPGTVDFISYSPKKIVLKSQSSAASVLLLNDRYDPNWQVTVDGLPARLLRCNFIMRGVQLAAGPHIIDFRFTPPMDLFYLSLTAVLTTFGILGVLVIAAKRESVIAGMSPSAKEIKLQQDRACCPPRATERQKRVVR
jgi:hypothetical protein